jgi:hypothetical protein
VGSNFKCAAVALAVCFAAPLRASEPERTFSLEFAVPPGCPDRRAFVAAVTSRARASEVATEATGFALKIEIEGEPERASGRLGIRLADGQESLREIPVGSCREVLTSMAVISALVLEGRGLDAPLPASPAAQTAISDAPSKLEREPPAELRARASPGASPGAPAARLQIRGRLQGSVETAVAAGASPGIGFGAELSWQRASWLAPSGGLLGRFVAGGRESTRFGDAHFRLLAVSLTACPARFRPLRAASVMPCLLFDAGQLRGDGRRTLNRATQFMPWLGVGAAFRAEAPLATMLALELQAHATGLFHHDRFVFEPGLVAHDVPPLAFGLSAGLLLGPQ